MATKTIFGRHYAPGPGGCHGPDPDLTLLMILGVIIGGGAALLADADFATVWGAVVIYGLIGAYLLRGIAWIIRQWGSDRPKAQIAPDLEHPRVVSAAEAAADKEQATRERAAHRRAARIAERRAALDEEASRQWNIRHIAMGVERAERVNRDRDGDRDSSAG